MPTPVGPVTPDPDDPDLWPEWYADDDAEPPRHRPAVRAVALVLVLSLVLLVLVSLI